MNCPNCARLREELELQRIRARNAEASADLWRKEATANLNLALTELENTAMFMDRLTGKKEKED